MLLRNCIRDFIPGLTYWSQPTLNRRLMRRRALCFNTLMPRTCRRGAHTAPTTIAHTRIHEPHAHGHGARGLRSIFHDAAPSRLQKLEDRQCDRINYAASTPARHSVCDKYSGQFCCCRDDQLRDAKYGRVRPMRRVQHPGTRAESESATESACCHAVSQTVRQCQHGILELPRHRDKQPR